MRSAFQVRVGSAQSQGVWTLIERFHTFSYGNHISSVFEARSTGTRRERAFAFLGSGL